MGSRATMIGWTGRGRLNDLRTSVSRVLAREGVRGAVRKSGSILLVEGAEPTRVAFLVRLMPGVRWVAVGSAASSIAGLGATAGELARRYLRRGDRFSVIVGPVANVAAGDVAGAVTSAALTSVKGVRVDEEEQKLRFRAAFDGKRGAVGVELSEGPGGTPLGGGQAVCLVSGGKHSSVLSWMAVLSGHRLHMVHAKVDEESLLAVARLYAELSHRVDPSALTLEVLWGGDSSSLLVGFLQKEHQRVFAGFHSGCSRLPEALENKVEAPLFLMPEERFEREFEGLSLKPRLASLAWKKADGSRAKSATLSGVRVDVSGVLDGLG